LRAPRGALRASARAANVKIVQPMIVASTAMMAILLNDGATSCQRRMALMGGNSSAITFVS